MKKHLSLEKAIKNQIAKRRKYNNKIIKFDGHRFDSKAEYERYLVLQDMEKKGEISDLIVHPFFTLFVKGRKIGRIILDFTYYKKSLDKVVYEDVKGVDTALSRWKRKCVEAEFNIKVEVIKKRKK